MVIALMRDMGRVEMYLVLPVLLLWLAYLVVTRLVEPMPRTILTGSMVRFGRRGLLRLLATIGLAQVLWLGLLWLAVLVR